MQHLTSSDLATVMSPTGYEITSPNTSAHRALKTRRSSPDNAITIVAEPEAIAWQAHKPAMPIAYTQEQ